MKVYVQWAKSHAEDWSEFDIKSPSSVRALPKRPVPKASDAVDGQPGWVSAVNVQGVVFEGYDHIAIEPLPGDTLVVTGWVDDADDYDGQDIRWATQWRLSPPAPDPMLGGRLNTVQTRTTWATAATGYPGALPWDEFAPPPAAVTLHGIWLPDHVWAEHVKTRTLRGWREWLQ